MTQSDFEILENQIDATITAFAFDAGTQTYNIDYTSPNPDEDGTHREVLVRVTDPDKGVGFNVTSYTAPLSGIIVRVLDSTEKRGDQILIPVEISYLLVEIRFEESPDGELKIPISIYDLSGSLIRTLSLGRQTPGFYVGKDQAAYWDGKNSIGEPVSSGVYFYTFRAGDFVATKKLLMVK